MAVVNYDGNGRSVHNPAEVVKTVIELIEATGVTVYNTIAIAEDEELSGVYAVTDFSWDSAGDDQRSEGVYLDIEIYARASDYGDLYAADAAIRAALDKKRLLTNQYWFMVKWNRSNQIPTDQRGLLRLACQYYIKAESKRKI